MNIYEVKDPAIDTIIVEQSNAVEWLRSMRKYGYHQAPEANLIAGRSLVVMIRVIPAAELEKETPFIVLPLASNFEATIDDQLKCLT